jgi:hypothetical protein
MSFALLLTFGFIAVLLWVALCSRSRQRDRIQFKFLEGSPSCVSTETLKTFFGTPANFANRYIDELVDEIGPWQHYDNWDLGRFIYEWDCAEVRIRVITQSDYVACVEFLDPGDPGRFGTVVETVWERPQQNEGD